MQPDAARPVVARTGWVVLTAFLCELAVVAGVGNQLVTNAMTRYVSAPQRNFADYSRGAIDAMLTFHWRLAPRPAQAVHDWAAQFVLIAVLFVLTALGVWVTCRGPVTYWRVTVTVWAVVAACVPLAIMARNLLVIRSAPGPLQSRVGQSVYYYPLFGTALVAGLALGLVTGLITAAVARLTRRAVPVRGVGPAPYDPQDHYLEDRFGDDVPERMTAQLPPLPQEPPTRTLLATEPDRPAAAPPWSAPEQPTAAIPGVEPERPAAAPPW
ncbi:MAG: hypothetical protein EPN43_11880, partial [Jatrophihabitans sp.]